MVYQCYFYHPFPAGYINDISIACIRCDSIAKMLRRCPISYESIDIHFTQIDVWVVYVVREKSTFAMSYFCSLICINYNVTFPFIHECHSHFCVPKTVQLVLSICNYIRVTTRCG